MSGDESPLPTPEYLEEIRERWWREAHTSPHTPARLLSTLNHAKGLRIRLAEIEAAHDRRVTELLEANNREVERRRAAEMERDRWKACATREMAENWKGNIEAVDKLGLNAMDAQAILMAVQSWAISTGRARELLRCWVLGTFDAKVMLANAEPMDIREDEDPAEFVARMKAEARKQAEAEIADLKASVVAFGAPWAVSYAKAHDLPEGHLHPHHYDILEKAGARMDDFTRAQMEGGDG